jgi:hypothetical protein
VIRHLDRREHAAIWSASFADRTVDQAVEIGDPLWFAQGGGKLPDDEADPLQVDLASMGGE